MLYIHWNVIRLASLITKILETCAVIHDGQLVLWSFYHWLRLWAKNSNAPLVNVLDALLFRMPNCYCSSTGSNILSNQIYSICASFKFNRADKEQLYHWKNYNGHATWNLYAIISWNDRSICRHYVTSSHDSHKKWFITSMLKIPIDVLSPLIIYILYWTVMSCPCFFQEYWNSYMNLCVNMHNI